MCACLCQIAALPDSRHVADKYCVLSATSMVVGPVYDAVNGVYHLFFQDHLAEPAGGGAGPVYGHAASRDLGVCALPPLRVFLQRWLPVVLTTAVCAVSRQPTGCVCPWQSGTMSCTTAKPFTLEVPQWWTARSISCIPQCAESSSSRTDRGLVSGGRTAKRAEGCPSLCPLIVPTLFSQTGASVSLAQETPSPTTPSATQAPRGRRRSASGGTYV